MGEGGKKKHIKADEGMWKRWLHWHSITLSDFINEGQIKLG